MADNNQELKISIVTDADVSGFKQASQASADLNREMGVVQVSQKDVESATKSASLATEHETIKKKELKEIIRKLTADYPVLGEVARMALNPIVLAVAGPVLAYEIWTRRVEALTQALGGIAMPDLSAGIEQAKNLGAHWQGIAESIAKANKEFNSPESVFKRTEDTIGKQADADKKLNDLNKQKALANLELNKGTMTGAQYDVAHAGIENFYAQRDYNIGAKADEDRRKAKEQEIHNAATKARELADQEKNFKLPETKKEFDAQQESLKKSADAHRKEQEINAAEVAKINDTQATSQDGIGGAIRSIPGAVRFNLVHGYGGDEKADQVKAEQSKMARRSGSIADSIEKEIARRQKLFDDRERVRGEAADAAGTSQRLNLDAPHEAENLRRDRATNRTLNQGQQEINVSKALANVTGNGAHVEKAVDAVAAAIARRDFVTALKLQELARQIHAAPQNTR